MFSSSFPYHILYGISFAFLRHFFLYLTAFWFHAPISPGSPPYRPLHPPTTTTCLSIHSISHPFVQVTSEAGIWIQNVHTATVAKKRLQLRKSLPTFCLICFCFFLALSLPVSHSLSLSVQHPIYYVNERWMIIVLGGTAAPA